MDDDELKLSLHDIKDFIKEQKIKNLELSDLLGSGSYGEVWAGTFNNIPIVAKVEVLNNEENPTLYQEYINYKCLGQVVDVTQKNWKYSVSRFTGVPKCLLYKSSYGHNSNKNISKLHTVTESQNTRSLPSTSNSKSSATYLPDNQSMHLLILSRVGDNLKNVQKQQKNEKFSLLSIVKLAIVLLKILQHIHTNHIVHRDLKPSNICVPYFDENDSIEDIERKKHSVYILDFGLSKPYMVKTADGQFQHIPFKKTGGGCGTLYFMSIAAHSFCSADIRYDIQTLAYILVHFHHSLPWEKLARDKFIKKKYPDLKSSERKHKQHEEVFNMKKSFTSKQLCQNMPPLFAEFMDHCNAMQFADKFNYNYWIERFNILLSQNSLQFKQIKFEWVPQELFTLRLAHKQKNADENTEQNTIAPISPSCTKLKSKSDEKIDCKCEKCNQTTQSEIVSTINTTTTCKGSQNSTECTFLEQLHQNIFHNPVCY